MDSSERPTGLEISTEPAKLPSRDIALKGRFITVLPLLACSDGVDSLFSAMGD